MHKVFEFITETVGWLRIVASPLLAGGVIGVIIYFSLPTTLGIVLASIVVAIGLVVGIIWATRVWKKSGTINFLSRISATPELDNVDENKDKINTTKNKI